MPATLRLLACSPGVKTFQSGSSQNRLWRVAELRQAAGEEKLFSARLSCSPAASWNGAG